MEIPGLRLDGRVAVVTGTSAGLGRRFTQALDAAGASPVLATRRFDENVELAAGLRDALPVRCDVTVAVDRQAVVDAALDRFGRIDVLVNNTGDAVSLPAEDESDEQVRSMLEINTVGLFAMCRLVGRHMLERGAGSIINIASLAATAGLDRYPLASYVASKAAVVGLTRELAAQWASRGVRVKAISPSWFPTRTGGFLRDPDQVAWIGSRTPMGRPRPAGGDGRAAAVPGRAGVQLRHRPQPRRRRRVELPLTPRRGRFGAFATFVWLSSAWGVEMAVPEPIDLVLQGGGVKGVALAGAVTVMLQRYRVARVAGTSAGAILAALIAAGYDAAGIRAAMLDLNYRRVPDPARLPLVGTSLDLLTSNGLHSGNFIKEWIGNRLADRNVYDFDDLRLDDDPDRDPELSGDKGYRLVVTATDVTRGRALRLPWDYRAAFGIEPGRQSVAEAVRMSMSIPLFFRPCTVTDERSGEACTIVDGGVLTNFPLEIFDRRDGRCPRWATLGIGVIPDLPGKDSTIVPAYLTPTPPLRLLASVLITAVLGHDQTYLAQPENRERLTRINTDGVGIVEFGIDDARRDELFRRGERAAHDFLDTWDWPGFQARYLPQCAAAV